MGFDNHDLLQNVGYEEGSINWGPSFNTIETRTLTTTSTTYTDDFSQFNSIIQVSAYFPDAADVTWLGFCRVAPGTNETVDVQLYNFNAGEIVAEETGFTTDTFVTLGPTIYEPPDRTLDHAYRFRIRTNPGSNSSNLAQPTLSIGVEL